MERRERSLPPTQLTGAQERTAGAVITSLGRTDARLLIVIEGLSGVGKTSLLNAMGDSVTLNNGRVTELNTVLYGSRGGQPDTFNGHVVTTVTPDEAQHLASDRNRQYSSLTLVTHILPGMSQEEIDEYVAQLPNLVQAGLNANQITSYSLGIPLLAQQLTTPGLTEEMAAKVSARYLAIGFNRYFGFGDMVARAEPYLGINIPQAVIDAASGVATIDFQHIYDNLYNALQVRDELEQEGITEESPLFVAPQSEGIYNAMFKNRHDITDIDIFVPDLTPEVLERIQQVFGYATWRGYDQDRSNRAKMCNADYRKTSFWHKEPDSQAFLDINEDEGIGVKAEEYLKAYHEDKLPLKPSSKRTGRHFLVNSHEHHDHPYHAAFMGWMAESFLQQRGIAYYVNNHTYGTSYAYNPETRQIENESPIFETRL